MIEHQWRMITSISLQKKKKKEKRRGSASYEDHACLRVFRLGQGQSCKGACNTMPAA